MRGAWAAAIVATLWVMAARAAPPSGPSAPAAGPASPAPVAADPLPVAFDRAFSAQGRFRFTGAVVAVVRDGRVAFLKGYGHEDSAGRIPVDPGATRFRLGSITKTLVGVGMAQLIDQGRIRSLDTPVNSLRRGMALPHNDGRAITLRMLGTHQAGLAEARQPFRRPGDPMVRLDDAYLSAHFPGYVVPPNSGSNYSNYGAAVLGQVVADQTGMPFQAYAAQRIFAPLGMAQSVMIDSPAPPARLAQADAFYANGGKRRIPDNWANNPGNLAAGALASTGQDMARYMIALLGGGEGIPPLMSQHARDVVFARQGGTHPLTQGYGVLFMLNRWNGEPIVEHGGRTLGTSSYMTLLPDRRTGIFVAVTGDYGQTLPAAGLLGLPAPPVADRTQAGRTLPGLSQLRAIGLEALLGRWQLPFRPSAASTSDLSEYEGQYVGQRRSVRSVTQFFSDAFLGGPLTVAAAGRGTLLLGRTPYREVARDVFWHDPVLTPDRPSGWNDLLVFRRGADGRVTDASLLYTDVVFAKAQGPLTPGRVNWLLVGGALVLVTGLLSFLWARRSPGRVLAPVLAGFILLSPLVFFRSWPSAPVEALSFVWIRSADLAVFQLWLDATALLAAIVILLAVRAVAGATGLTGIRGVLARWHLGALGVGAVALIVAYAWYGMIGWNVG